MAKPKNVSDENGVLAKETEGKHFQEETEDPKFEEEPLPEKNNSENSSEDEERRILELRVQEAMNKSLKHRIEWWESKLWNDYLYKTREIDYLQLPNINAWLSEWNDDDSSDELSVFEKCRLCLQIIEKLKFAIAVCPYASEKQLELWKEGIKNAQGAISRKLDYMSFMLLKDAEEHLNLKTENMEYGATDGDDDGTTITLCLWANLYISDRKRGMDMLGFSFKLPMDIVVEDCAVRLMHTLFDHASPRIDIHEEILQTEHKEILEKAASKEIFEDQIEISGDQTEGNVGENVEDETKIELNEDVEDKDSTTEEENSSVVTEEEQPDIPEESVPSEEETSISNESAVFHPKQLPPLIEPEMKTVDPEEYFVVGGIFYFDLYLVPQQNVRTRKISYIHREMPKLRRILYKRKIVTPRTLEDNKSYAASAYEKLRFRKELDDAIFIQLQLPKKVIYLEDPEPARLFPEKEGYSKDCIYESNYNKDTKQITFKTNQFGIFSMLQKRYENFPYKKWSLTGGKAVRLAITGKHLEMEIQISHEGYALTFLNPDDEFILDEINSIWLAADLFVEKLESVGINIRRGSNAQRYVDVDSKELDLEDNVYDCIALLSGQCNFNSTKKSSSEKDQITLEYRIEKEKKTKTVVIRKCEVVDLEIKQKRIAKAKAAEEIEAEMEKDLESEKNISENQNIEGKITEEPIDKVTKMESDENVEEVALKDLYHYVLNEMNENQRKNVISTNACLIENVRALLRICRPLSSM